METRDNSVVCTCIVLALGCSAREETGSPFQITSVGDPSGMGDDVDDGGDGPLDDGGSEGGSEGEGGGNPGDIPCDVDDVLAAHCRQCHGETPSFGAPMPLASRGDFLVPASSDPSRTVLELVDARIHDGAAPMPPTGTLDAGALALLDEWIAAGAPRGDEDCGDDGGDPSGGDPGELPCAPTDILLAHGEGDEPFPVPLVDDVYMCFTYASPWPAGAQAIAGGPIIGDERVLHHWILYRTSEPQVDGGYGPCNMPFDATFVTGWAPGGENFVMPEGVGLELAGPDEWLILQVHYNNTAGYTDALDQSGVQICATDTPRPQTAGVLWLGSVYIGIPPGATNEEVTGTCYTDDWPQPLTIMASSPHMHQRGHAFRTEITRTNGAQETLVDVPQFSFDDQRDYPHDPPVVIDPGDVLRTTCVYDNPGPDWVIFGEATSDEMCFNFATAYPIDVLPQRTCGIL